MWARKPLYETRGVAVRLQHLERHSSAFTYHDHLSAQAFADSSWRQAKCPILSLSLVLLARAKPQKNCKCNIRNDHVVFSDFWGWLSHQSDSTGALTFCLVEEGGIYAPSSLLIALILLVTGSFGRQIERCDRTSSIENAKCPNFLMTLWGKKMYLSWSLEEDKKEKKTG